MLELLKVYLNIVGSEKDALLNTLIDESIAEFEDITNNTFRAGTNMEYAVIQMAIFKYNRLGLQGLASSSFSGSSETYTADYPRELKRMLVKYKKLRAV